MKAVFIEQGGGIDALHYAEQPDVALWSEEQVLVKVVAAGVNPIDTKIRAAPERFPVSMPSILGCDAAGLVVEVGNKVKNFKTGDAVYFSQPGFNRWQGTYAEYVVVDSSLLAHKPEKLSFQRAAAAPLVLITAWEALHGRANIQAGQTVLIHAGAGGVGHVAIQLAKLAGARVITTVSNAEKAQLARKMGAEAIINYKIHDVVQQVMEWTNGAGVDIALDTVGGSTFQSCLSCTRVYGDVVTILQPPADVNWGEARKRNLRLSFELMLSPVMLELTAAKQQQGEILRRCTEFFNQQTLQIEIAKSFALKDVAKAHEFLETAHPIGKVVIEVSDSNQA